MTYLVAFLIVGLLWYIRNRHIEILVLETKYKLFALRDKLRQKAMDGEVDPNSRLFEYLDRSISKCVEALPTLNIYFCMSLFFLHKKDPKYVEFRVKIMQELGESPELAEVFDEMGKTILAFMENRHKLLFNSVKVVLFTAVGSVMVYQQARDTFEESSGQVRLYPETSDACLT